MSMIPEHLALASANKGKLLELQQLLQPLGCQLSPLSQWSTVDVPETGYSFVENALIKARHAAKVASLPAIADDSGLCVLALQGAPGLYSSRYAGATASDADNLAKLLDDMHGIDQRAAYYHCTVVYVRDADDVAPVVCQGYWHGEIARAASGEGGFGYDPVFYDVASGKTVAQLSAQAKHALSHRGQALRQFMAWLRSSG
jgi:XTP/dITP diphosphohydrolase